MSSSRIGTRLARMKSLLRRAEVSLAERADGEEAVARPPRGARSVRLGDRDRETSTNAQMEGAADEPWGGNS